MVLASGGKPSKSWAVVVLSMILVAGAVYLDAPLEKHFGIEITEHGVSALITMFLGSTAGGVANASYKRLAAAKAAGVPAPQAIAKEFQGIIPGTTATAGADPRAAILHGHADNAPEDLKDLLANGAPEEDEEELPPGK